MQIPVAWQDEEYTHFNFGAKSRHVVSTTFKFCRKIFRGKVPYYANSTSIHSILLLLAGDDEMNPGDSVKCKICSRKIAVNHRSVACGTCGSSYHIKCGNILPKQHKVISTRNWTYNLCIHSNLPFSGLSNDSFCDLYNEDGNILNTSTSSHSPTDWFNVNINSHYKGNLKIGHLNVNSIYNGKADEILDLLNDCRFDVLFIGESKIDSSVSNSLFSHQLYRIVRCDRKRGAGGMLAFIRSSVKVLRRTNLEPEDIESICLDVKGIENS